MLIEDRHPRCLRQVQGDRQVETPSNKKQNQTQHLMSNPKKELTQEELEKIAGGKRGTPGSSSTTGRQTSTYTAPGRPKTPVHHRTSSSTG